MGSQNQANKCDDVEVIDLTNESAKCDVTITLDDSISIISSASSPRASIPPTPPSPVALSPLCPSQSQEKLASPSSPNSTLRFFEPSISDSSTISPKLTPKKAVSKAETQRLAKLARAEAKKIKEKQKEEEKLQKEVNRANAANKALENCTANIDREILSIIGDPEEIALKTLADESMIKYRLTEFPKLENSITWTYRRIEAVDGICVPKFKDSTWMIVMMQGSEYLKRLLAYKSNLEDSQSIKSFLCDVKRRSKSDIILMVYNLASHLKSERQKDAKNYRKTFKDTYESNGRVATVDIPTDTPSSTISTLSPTDLQESRLMLELELKHEFPDWKLHFEFYEKTNDVVQSIIKYTLSIARYEVKQKVRTSTGLDWAINMDKERAVDPTKSHEDLTKLWMTQLQQFSQITLPIAKAIAAEYPSPCALLDQYKQLTTEESEGLLAELYVQRNLRRQIGANISKRIYRFMSCEDPNVHIGYS